MQEETLELETRRVIHEYILKNPGSHLRKIARELNINLSTLRYHLDYLEKKELVASEKESNQKAYFVAWKLSSKDKQACRLLQQKRFRDVILVIIMTPGINHRKIAEKLAITPSTLSKYLKLLEDRGVVHHQKAGREKCYRVVDEKQIMDLLLTYKKSFWDKFVDNVLEIYFER
ncbi:MAG: winged helix-turn-helix transcriptional regulator [Candidatus Odinarchaeota archaeon]